MLSTEGRLHLLVLALAAVLACWLLADGFQPDHVLISNESLRHSLPWSAVLGPAEAHNRFVGDQPRIFYPYLLEAARVYAGEADALWTSRGGGGQPFLGNITSSLLHPLTLLAAVLPVTLVPLLQALAILVLGTFFTWAFLRRLGVCVPAALFGGLAFGFGGHQVFWLQYALSHTLVALPFCMWATERVVEDRSRRRAALLTLGLAMLVFGGHPETGYVAGLVAGLWAAWRLWDSHGRWVVVTAGLTALGLSAVQWLPFLEYATFSHGLKLREVEAANLEGGVSLGAAAIFGLFVVAALALIKGSARPGLSRHVLSVGVATVVLVMARRMGMAVAAGVLLLPELYGHPVGGQPFSGAQDFPGLQAGYAGVLPPVLTLLALLTGYGGGITRFFAVGALLLWGAAHHMPGIETLVRAVPGLSEVGATRLLGPVGFLTACGGAWFLHGLCRKVGGGTLASTGRLALVVGASLVMAFVALRLPVDPHGGRTIIAGLRAPDHRVVHDGHGQLPICFDLDEPADDLSILVDGMRLRRGPAPASEPDQPHTVLLALGRVEEGRHRLRVEARRGEELEVLADQPLAIRRERSLSTRDLAMLAGALGLLGWLVARRRPQGAWWAAGLVTLDVLSLGWGYNPATPADELFPPTETVAFLQAQQQAEGPFRIFTEGTILPPDTQFAVGLEHLLSYDNLGFHRTYQLLLEVPLKMDHFATFSFDKDSVAYGSPRFDLLDVRYVLTDRETDLSDRAGMNLVHESETRIWENRGNLGRAFVVGETAHMSPGTRDHLLTLDPSRVAFLEQAWEEPLGGTGTATVLRHEGSEVLVATETDGPALLILAENRAPGWQARVDDGEWQETLPAYAAWQAVSVPEGRHEVLFRYRPHSVVWGLWLSLAALVVVLLNLILPRHLL